MLANWRRLSKQTIFSVHMQPPLLTLISDLLSNAYAAGFSDWQKGLDGFLVNLHSTSQTFSILKRIKHAQQIVQHLDSKHFGKLKDDCEQGLTTYEGELIAWRVHLRHAPLVSSTQTSNEHNLRPNSYILQNNEKREVPDLKDDDVNLDHLDLTLEGWFWVGQCMDSFETFVCVYVVLLLSFDDNILPMEVQPATSWEAARWSRI